jgi:hypothetical protein
MDLNLLASSIGLIGAAFCVGAYVYGYVWKPAGFRWLNILSLFCTTVALGQLSFLIHSQAPPSGSPNTAYALVFVLISGLAQALMAVKARRVRRTGAEPEPGSERA